MYLLESLLVLFCGKDSGKKKKVRDILNSIRYNNDTKEFICKSSRFPEKTYTVIYSHGDRSWKCDCEAGVWRRYELYDSPEERYRLKKVGECIHCKACRIYQVLQHNIASL